MNKYIANIQDISVVSDFITGPGSQTISESSSKSETPCIYGIQDIKMFGDLQ